MNAGRQLKILLVKPHASLDAAKNVYAFLQLEPLELEVVAAGIDRRHEIRILDLITERRPFPVFERTLREFRPDLIGITGFSNQMSHANKAAAMAKDILPGVVIVAGGIHATTLTQDFAGSKVVDLVVRGEGGTVIGSIVESIARGEKPPENESILHVASPRFAEMAKAPPPMWPEADQIPIARRDLIDRSRYYCMWWRPERNLRLKRLFPQVATLRTTMGCPFQCAFCVVPYVYHRRYLLRSPERVADEIAALKEDHVYFVDDEMFANAKHAEEIARLLIARGIRKHYISWARCDTICRHPDLFRLWKEAGLDMLYVGVESMEPENLELYNKKCDPEVNRKALQILRDLGIGLHAFLLVNPDFEVKDFHKVRDAIFAISPATFTITVFTPAPGTALWEENLRNFICPDPYSLFDLMHTLMPTRLPLVDFYRYFSLLYLYSIKDNPWRRFNIQVPLRDKLRIFKNWAIYGWGMRNMYRAYDRKYWHASPAGLPHAPA